LSGYYNRPDATSQAFLAEGWYRTGDLGYLAAGELYVSGRMKDLIIVGGKNIYPQDIEAAASQVAGVHPGRVVAFGLFDEIAGTEEVVLVAEVDTADPATREVLAEAVRQAVTRNTAIALRKVHLVEAGWVIKTSSGKTARGANRERYLRETATEVTEIEEKNEREDWEERAEGKLKIESHVELRHNIMIHGYNRRILCRGKICQMNSLTRSSGQPSKYTGFLAQDCLNRFMKKHCAWNLPNVE